MEALGYIFMILMFISGAVAIIAIVLDIDALVKIGYTAMFTFVISYFVIQKENPYKQGQIDALTGKIKYELKTNPDSTKTWEFIEKEDENVKN